MAWAPNSPQMLCLHRMSRGHNWTPIGFNCARRFTATVDLRHLGLVDAEELGCLGLAELAFFENLHDIVEHEDRSMMGVLRGLSA